jgi:hypothetical protein
MFDAIIMANPLYQPDTSRWAPDTIAALRGSRQLLLPSIALRDYGKALALLESGNYEQATVAGNRVLRIIEVAGVDEATAGVRSNVQRLLERAASLKAVEEARIYTIADDGVTPPTALGRQLPAVPPQGMSNRLVGRLELLIGRNGQVESVRLYTPLNRYHERMIVSAAKAWRYTPAMKEGKPVRFQLTSAITLPES